jgi:hypothetical protein
MRTRFVSVFLASVFALPLAFAACSSDDTADDEPFDTLQDCFDDHHSGAEGLSITEAITVCCIDHPIAGVKPSCGNTQAQCEDHVDLELDPASASETDISDACADYLDNL